MSAGVNFRQTGPQTYGEAADEMLILWSAQGDRRAFDEIVGRHGAFALRVASRVIPDKVIAEDVVQEAMVRAWSQAGRFDPGRAQFRTWLYRIVVNLCIDQRRRIAPDQMPEDYDAIDEGPGAEEMVAVRERDVALRAALGTLPARQRAVLTLVYDEGVSGAEAGRILGLSAKAVERLLARARDHLRERMRPYGGRKE
ncbi:MAG TPA: sigma-70 family RNA polymerase sigma factor [Acidisoma sp.]|uniref:RNA polymerase sigma factor n=1 Tax=Acidisoma sp. TaxID=1872115 RepID=UPI002BF19A55|nr:sigma-70 family RNA polymerase sigma factor [Acidisoma sp.]HTH99472.1 sigma-70 family RNA polymerase sigma factor [Acidisoma sp.]